MGNVHYIDFVRSCLEINPEMTNEQIKELFTGKRFWLFGMEQTFDRSGVISNHEIDHARQKIKQAIEGQLLPILDIHRPIATLQGTELQAALERIAFVIQSMTEVQIHWELPVNDPVLV